MPSRQSDPYCTAGSRLKAKKNNVLKIVGIPGSATQRRWTWVGFGFINPWVGLGSGFYHFLVRWVADFEKKTDARSVTRRRLGRSQHAATTHRPSLASFIIQNPG